MSHSVLGTQVISPLQTRRVALASGTRAKTDAVNARMLAKRGWLLVFCLKSLAPKQSLILKNLHVARTSFVMDRTRMQNRA